MRRGANAGMMAAAEGANGSPGLAVRARVPVVRAVRRRVGAVAAARRSSSSVPATRHTGPRRGPAGRDRDRGHQGPGHQRRRTAAAAGPGPRRLPGRARGAHDQHRRGRRLRADRAARGPLHRHGVAKRPPAAGVRAEVSRRAGQARGGRRRGNGALHRRRPAEGRGHLGPHPGRGGRSHRGGPGVCPPAALLPGTAASGTHERDDADRRHGAVPGDGSGARHLPGAGRHARIVGGGQGQDGAGVRAHLLPGCDQPGAGAAGEDRDRAGSHEHRLRACGGTRRERERHRAERRRPAAGRRQRFDRPGVQRPGRGHHVERRLGHGRARRLVADAGHPARRIPGSPCGPAPPAASNGPHSRSSSTARTSRG